MANAAVLASKAFFYFSAARSHDFRWLFLSSYSQISLNQWEYHFIFEKKVNFQTFLVDRKSVNMNPKNSNRKR